MKLKDLCATFNATSEESVRKVADTIWSKTSKETPTGEKEEPLKLVPPGGGGSGEKTEEERLKERYPTMT